MGKCSTVVSGAEWPGVTINQGGKKSVGRKKIVRNLARRYIPKISSPSSYYDPLISSIRQYPPLIATFWYQLLFDFKFATKSSSISCPFKLHWVVVYWVYHLWYRYRYTITNVLVYLHIVEAPRHGLGGRYLILLAGSWYAALTIPQLSKHYSVGLYFRSTSIVRGKDELEMFAD